MANAIGVNNSTVTSNPFTGQSYYNTQGTTPYSTDNSIFYTNNQNTQTSNQTSTIDPNDTVAVLKTIKKYFSTLDTAKQGDASKADQKVGGKDFDTIMKNPDKYPPDLVQAVSVLTDKNNKDLYHLLDNPSAAEGKDGGMKSVLKFMLCPIAALFHKTYDRKFNMKDLDEAIRYSTEQQKKEAEKQSLQTTGKSSSSTLATA